MLYGALEPGKCPGHMILMRIALWKFSSWEKNLLNYECHFGGVKPMFKKIKELFFIGQFDN